MIKSHRSLAVFLGSATVAATSLLLVGWASATSPVIIPDAAATVEGNSDNLYPFNGEGCRYQQVIVSGEFSGTPCWIQGFALRPDSVGGQAFSVTLDAVKIRLSTTTAAPGTLSRTFASNLGSDATTVYNGSLALSSQNTGPDAGPKSFDIVVNFQAPFYYDPAKGNLLLDVLTTSGGTTSQFDAQDASDTTSRLWNDDPNATTAVANDPYPSLGLVIKFLMY